MEDTLTRARCLSCGKGLAFDEWSSGADRCDRCQRAPSGPAATYVRGPRPARETETAAYMRLLDEVPDELIDELVAALEAEAERRPVAPTPASAPAFAAVQDVLRDLGLGQSTRELSWAAWGFVAGFALNVAVAKFAQVSSGAPFGQFVVPMLVGGLVAGAACGAIGWGLARLRER
jgi:hypothetical protein